MDPDKSTEVKKTPKRMSRRRSSATLPDVEFVSVEQTGNSLMYLPEEALTFEEAKTMVSPIKIVGQNSIVKMRKSSSKKEVNGNYLTKSPAIDRVMSAKRNLNISLDDDVNSTADNSDVLNYSIVTEGAKTPAGPDNMRIKLRLSEKQTPTNSRRVSTRRRSRLAEDLEASTPTSSACTDRKRPGQPIEPSELLKTPPKRNKLLENIADVAPSTPLSAVTTARRKSILKTPGSKNNIGTPKRSIHLTNIVEERVYDKEAIISTPTRKTERTRKAETDVQTPTKRKAATPTRKRISKVDKENEEEVTMTPSRRKKLLKAGDLTPTIQKRQTQSDRRKSDIQITRERLHVSAIPSSLPCRETEFETIYSFLQGKILDQCGGCMYISGVPGTGKTATVTGVIRSLQKEVAKDEILPFEFIEINGMRLTEPRQAYVEIYKKLTGKSLSWEHAHTLLEKRFTTPAPHRKTTVLLVDELDILCNRRQDVVYNLLDWPTKSAARLVVITIANTMDLPERLLMGKVTSRLGLTRLTFSPYTHKQLQEIVTMRICGSESFKSDAVQLVSRKVAALSGDARRALDICRRATDIAEASARETKKVQVNMQHVQEALSEMISSSKVQAIKCCSRFEKVFLQAVIAEFTRTGVEETNLSNVYNQIETIVRFLGYPVPPITIAMKTCSKLTSERIIIGEHSRNDIFQKILLNVSMDDIHYALQVNNNDLN